MKFYPGDRVVRLTMGGDKAAVVAEWADITKAEISHTVDRVVVRDGTWAVSGDVRMSTGEGLPPFSAIVTISKMENRPWYNHIRAIFQP